MKIRQWNMTKHPACFITGDSGDGKTWLCTQMAEEAMQAGATVILADPVKGWDIGEPRLRRLKQAGATIIGMDEYNRLVNTLDDVLAANILVEPAPPLILMVDDFTSLLWVRQHPEGTPTDMLNRIERLIRRFEAILRDAQQSDIIKLVFSGQRIEKSMLPATWKEVWEAGAHLLSMQINGTYEVFSGESDMFGNIIYPELVRSLIEQANRPDVATMRMVTAHIREELEAQRTMLADRRRMGIGDNAMQVGAITALERLNAWCAQQYDTTNPCKGSNRWKHTPLTESSTRAAASLSSTCIF